jgi:hypothetical protein
MPNLYFTNSTGNALWGDVSNWNTAADGSGDNPTAAPWGGGSEYDNYDLLDASNGTTALAYNGIYNNGTGKCYVNVYASGMGGPSIQGGSYYGSVTVERWLGPHFGDFSNATSVSVNFGEYNGILYFFGSPATGFYQYGPVYFVSGYYIGGVLTTLDATGNGTWNGATYVNGATEVQNGWIDGVYYINDVATDLPESGSGFWNGSYYINGTATSLDQSGNGMWIGGPEFGVYLNGVITGLDPAGNGVVDGQWYSGFTPNNTITGWQSFSDWRGGPTEYAYFILGQQTTLDQSGNGTWNGDNYVNGEVQVALNGWVDGVYYINNVATPLDENGDGFMEGLFYHEGELANGPVTFTNGSGSAPPSINIGQLIGLPPFVQL